MTTRRQRKYDDVHSRILAAASDGFTYRPMNLIGMDAIAEHAEVARSVINSHFGDKKLLFAAVVERECKLALAEMWLAVEDAGEFPDSLKAFALARFKETARLFLYRKLNRQKFRDMPQVKDALDRFLRDERKLLHEVLQSAADAKQIAKRDFANAADAVLGALNGFQYFREYGDAPESEIIKILGDLMDIVIAGLLK